MKEDAAGVLVHAVGIGPTLATFFFAALPALYPQILALLLYTFVLSSALAGAMNARDILERRKI